MGTLTVTCATCGGTQFADLSGPGSRVPDWHCAACGGTHVQVVPD